ncbi:18S rRNA maturation protein [Stygiomarasmius scandens]|uniref:rRNA-processing protein EFG1 n=1 Tax=Marasmiellus scandens TaxID=2682957 RepID=A0ABR1IMG1_9AGAR
MGPTRTEKHSSRSKAPHPEAGPSKRRAKRSDADSDSLPGVQKIKSALRQTRRLLAKDKLAADVRVTAERKLKSLEEDLAKAEQSRKERKMATKYHKVKFFERQKVVRRINQLKKNLAGADKSSATKLEAELFEQRVNLNYIMYYPKTKKYISLFPPELRHKDDTEQAESQSETSSSNAECDEIKNWIREQMTKGHLPMEAEASKENNAKSSKKVSSQQYPEKSAKQKKPKAEEAQAVKEDKDDFFEDDDDSEGDSEVDEEE